MKDFGIRLKKLREGRELSIENLAKALGIKELPLKYWEKGEMTLTISKLIQLAKFFNVSVDYLLGL